MKENAVGNFFIFPLFTLTSALLVAVFWWLPQVVPWLASPWVGGMGAAAILVAVVLGWKKVVRPPVAYDIFLWGTLLVWAMYWQYVFGSEAPLFKAYPVYFVILEALTRYFVIHHSERWSLEELRFLEWFVEGWWCRGWLLGGLVLLSLAMTRHYLIYPISVGLLIVRCALLWTVRSHG
ncbi:MAG: hypothetical protein AXA67_09930 [Methylothermaceae bacteria B42]|nr:MAG: hypothetical protein AXA67_09930 [Methylothermaceae bacteria B42]HHJ39622.1 hypothetical protein [Methylothermaceae bacterium]